MFGKQNWTESRTKSSCSTGKPTGALLGSSKGRVAVQDRGSQVQIKRKKSIDDTHPLEGKDKAKQKLALEFCAREPSHHVKAKDYNSFGFFLNITDDLLLTPQ